MESPPQDSWFVRALEGLLEVSFWLLGFFFKALFWVFNELSLYIGLVLCLALIVIGLHALHTVVSQPMRRRERARMFLSLLELGDSGGRSVEQTIIDLSRRRETSMGVSFHVLAAYLEQGLPLMAALDKVPQLLPPAVLAMLRAGAESGDLKRVLPCCRAHLREATPNLQRCGNYLFTLGAVILPVQFWFFAVIRVAVWPRFGEMMKDMAGEAGAYRLFDITTVDHAWPVFFLVICLPVIVAGAAHILGPNTWRWFTRERFAKSGRPRDGWLERLRQRTELLVPWVRRRRQRDFSAMLALLLDAGVPEPQAVRLAGESTANGSLAAQANRVVEELARGIKLPEALRLMDDSGALAWRMKNAAQGGSPFRAALAGWHDALDARATQQEQSAAYVLSSVCVIANGGLVGLLAFGIFHCLITLIDVASTW